MYSSLELCCEGSFHTFLTAHFVVINDAASSSLLLLYGVPQGSVSGPILFTLYTQPLVNVINDHNFNHPKFTDEIQLCIASKPGPFRSPNPVLSHQSVDDPKQT